MQIKAFGLQALKLLLKHGDSLCYKAGKNVCPMINGKNPV